MHKRLFLNRETLTVLDRSQDIVGGYTTDICETLISRAMTCDVCPTNQNNSACNGCGSSHYPSRCYCPM